MNIFFKVKIGNYEHLKQLQSEGVVFCNSLKYFTSIDDNFVRGDKHEDVFDVETYKDTIIFLKPANEPDNSYKKLNVTWAQMLKRNSDSLGNLYCLYCVDMTNATDEGQISVDERNSEFGTHALVFLDTEKFEERLYNEIKKRNLKFYAGYIDYIDLRNHSGEKTLFQKDIKYKYQNEFRIFIEHKSEEPLMLKIGDLSDITMLVSFESFRNLKYKRS